MEKNPPPDAEGNDERNRWKQEFDNQFDQFDNQDSVVFGQLGLMLHISYLKKLFIKYETL